MERKHNIIDQEQLSYEERRARRRNALRKRKKRQFILHTILGLVILVMIGITGAEIYHVVKGRGKKEAARLLPPVKIVEQAPEYDVQLLTMNEYSRPGKAIEKVNGIVVHYTANPGTSAQQNRDYFEGLKDSGETSASSHFVIGLEGEIIQCIPCKEIAYASNDRNRDTIAIECCIPDETGQFSAKTYDTLVHFTAWLMGRYSLSIDSVIRHYDITGKNCPKYFVEHEDAWKQFKEDVRQYIEINGVEKTKGTEAS